jgi:hypothetical protein
MNNGILIFAHNNPELDYVVMSLIAGSLAKKHLKVPVSLVSDESTIEWARKSRIHSRIKKVFDKIILVDRPDITNYRNLSDGNESKKVPFINANRKTAYELTPYDNTLLIDSDFLIFSDHLNNFWNLEYDVMIGNSMNEVVGTRAGILDKRVSEIGSHMFWATTVMFKKNHRSKTFFDLVSYIKENYKYYADLYRFDSRQYRNDISFSIARHILHGFEESSVGALPDITTVLDTDVLYDVKADGNLVFLISDTHNPYKYLLSSTKNTDIHILNKQSIVRNKNKLLRLI